MDPRNTGIQNKMFFTFYQKVISILYDQWTKPAGQWVPQDQGGLLELLVPLVHQSLLYVLTSCWQPASWKLTTFCYCFLWVPGAKCSVATKLPSSSPPWWFVWLCCIKNNKQNLFIFHNHRKHGMSLGSCSRSICC